MNAGSAHAAAAGPGDLSCAAGPAPPPRTQDTPVQPGLRGATLRPRGFRVSLSSRVMWPFSPRPVSHEPRCECRETFSARSFAGPASRPAPGDRGPHPAAALRARPSAGAALPLQPPQPGPLRARSGRGDRAAGRRWTGPRRPPLSPGPDAHHLAVTGGGNRLRDGGEAPTCQRPAPVPRVHPGERLRATPGGEAVRGDQPRTLPTRLCAHSRPGRRGGIRGARPTAARAAR